MCVFVHVLSNALLVTYTHLYISIHTLAIARRWCSLRCCMTLDIWKCVCLCTCRLLYCVRHTPISVNLYNQLQWRGAGVLCAVAWVFICGNVCVWARLVYYIVRDIYASLYIYTHSCDGKALVLSALSHDSKDMRVCVCVFPRRIARDIHPSIQIYTHSGDGKALVLFALSPAEGSAHESLCTLRFSSLISQCELGKASRHIVADKDPDAKRPCTGLLYVMYDSYLCMYMLIRWQGLPPYCCGQGPWCQAPLHWFVVSNI